MRPHRHALTACLLFVAATVSTSPANETKPLAAWSFKQDSSGWTAIKDCSLKVSDGVLRVQCTGNDPHMVAPVMVKAGWHRLTLRARFRGRINGQVFWETRTRKGFSEAQSETFQFRSNGNNWTDHHVFFHSDSDLVQLRLDPRSRKGRVELAAISLERKQPPAPLATPVKRIKAPAGFQVELLYSVPIKQQGSWVTLATDPKGRLITSDQYGKLYRVTPPPIGQSDKGIKLEPIPADIGMAHGIVYAFDSLYVMTNGPKAGLYRVTDSDGDDQFDTVKKLRDVPGGGEHGPHAVILAPDGKSLYVCAGNHTNLPKMEKSVVPRNWQEDILHERMWDAGGHAVGKMAPGGWIARINPEGTVWELISVGYRNEFDIAFNADGELFTFDADMEWDIGSPWYRPTRVCHVTAGSEFGWRSGTGKWPTWYPDSLPPVVDIGPGCPTGITFGTGAKFPAKYQKALFLSDWSYGILYAVHMTPNGSTYSGTAERFLSAAPLQLTDVLINPSDGAMYFTIGGRRTQSGLYRVTYSGKESTVAVDGKNVDGQKERTLRRQLEALQRPGPVGVSESLWPHLASPDRHIRFAARVAIEHQPVERWARRALSETRPRARIEAAIALARHGDKSLQVALITSLSRTKLSSLDQAGQLGLLRAYGLAALRMGRPTGATRKTILDHVDGLFPAESASLNRELAQLLIYLDAPAVVPRTLALLTAARTQQDRLQYALLLRKQTNGWTREGRKAYFDSFNAAAAARGGHSFAGFLANIRNEAIAALPASEKQALAKTLAAVVKPNSVAPDATKRKFVRKWTTDSLLPALAQPLTGRNFEKGQQLFAAASCFKCHRFRGQGGIVGPDLTAASRRFNNKDLLDSMTIPSRTISDQYQASMFVLSNGKTVIGRVANLSGQNIMVMTNMLEPGKFTAVQRDTIEEVIPSKTSLMPEGLLNTLTRDEILDLVAYIRSGGDPGHQAFDKK
ncbi:MAG TPA: heme-binding protein [Planctomycetaceae bacterium]|nr:heme-binding protein [Planctomycetaceae bacterium]|tara:strand:- start:673 stop:3576 length:2904 start_codon:yes stop_codon:yes gene_type:complete